MTIYEILKSNGRRSKYASLELAKAGFKQGDKAIYEVEIIPFRVQSLVDNSQPKRKCERVVYE